MTTPIVHDEFKGLRITPNVYTTPGRDRRLLRPHGDDPEDGPARLTHCPVAGTPRRGPVSLSAGGTTMTRTARLDAPVAALALAAPGLVRLGRAGYSL